MGEAGLNGQDRDRCGREAVSYPSLDAMPKYIQLVLHSYKGCVKIRTVQKHRGEEGRGQSMAEIRWEAFSWGGEPFDRVQGALG